MRFILYSVLLSIFASVIFPDVYSAIAAGLTFSIALQIVLKSHESFVFREWALLLYSVNYLLAPAITYQLEIEKVAYPMRIDSNTYFTLALPGFLFLTLGMFIIPTVIFKPNFSEILKTSLLNNGILMNLTVLGIGCRLIADVFSNDFAFFFYILSLLRFVGVFALFSSNPRKYRWLLFLVMAVELYFSFKSAMFHDVLMWFIFFGLFSLYLSKPSVVLRLVGATLLIILVLLIQAFKLDYRDRVWRGGEIASFDVISDVGLGKANSEDLIGEDNLLGALNRGNQAWIFASTVDNMNRNKNFQGMNNVYLYLESALLPRFLAPNKITAGNRVIFNQFSGHQIGAGTAMGLGVFADGYIAYGQWGVYVFTFVLGLLFALTFKLVERWSKISIVYVLLILPMLNYAVRPDCELQTVINHLAKSILVYGGVVYLTKYRFTINTMNLNKI